VQVIQRAERHYAPFLVAIEHELHHGISYATSGLIVVLAFVVSANLGNESAPKRATLSAISRHSTQTQRIEVFPVRAVHHSKVLATGVRTFLKIRSHIHLNGGTLSGNDFNKRTHTSALLI
jgi:hypothetical protein